MLNPSTVMRSTHFEFGKRCDRWFAKSPSNFCLQTLPFSGLFHQMEIKPKNSGNVARLVLLKCVKNDDRSHMWLMSAHNTGSYWCGCKHGFLSSLFVFVFCYSQQQDQWCRAVRYPNTCCVGDKTAELWTVQGAAVTSVGSSCLPAERRATLSQIVVPLLKKRKNLTRTCICDQTWGAVTELNHHTIKQHLRTKPKLESNMSAPVGEPEPCGCGELEHLKGKKYKQRGAEVGRKQIPLRHVFRLFEGSLYFLLWPVQWEEGTAGGQ